MNNKSVNVLHFYEFIMKFVRFKNMIWSLKEVEKLYFRSNNFNNIISNNVSYF